MAEKTFYSKDEVDVIIEDTRKDMIDIIEDKLTVKVENVTMEPYTDSNLSFRILSIEEDND